VISICSFGPVNKKKRDPVCVCGERERERNNVSKEKKKKKKTKRKICHLSFYYSE
jgi:hypothetical protein